LDVSNNRIKEIQLEIRNMSKLKISYGSVAQGYASTNSTILTRPGSYESVAQGYVSTNSTILTRSGSY